MAKVFAFLRNMDGEDKAKVLKVTGIVVALFTLFTLMSTVSYLFTWKADQSILATSVGDTSVKAANYGSNMGFRLADFLVRKCFGLGSLALCVFLFAVSARLLAGRWRRSLSKTLFLSLFGALLASFIFAYVSRLGSWENVFGGGLGGECGRTAVHWLVTMFGDIITALLLLALAALFLYMTSTKFARWFDSLSGRAIPGEAGDGKPSGEGAGATVGGTAAEPVPEPVPEPTPARKPAATASPDKVPSGRRSPLPSDGGQAVPAAAKDGGGIERLAGKDLSTDVKRELKRIDVRIDTNEGGLPKYQFPSLELLEKHDMGRYEVSDEELARNNKKIRETLENYRIQITDVKAVVGPTVTLYKVYPAPGVKISEIKKLQEDIGMYLHAKGVRVVTLTDSVGIEVANDRPSIVPMRAVLNDEAFRSSKAELPIAIGCTIQKTVKVFDLADAPHLLVAGATKQGKSVGLNAIVASLLYSKHPAELKLVFIDPKMVEFSAYERLIKHYLAVVPANDEKEVMDNAIVKKADKADKVLKSLVAEMEERYELLSKAYVQNIKQYNEKYKNRNLLPSDGHKFLPYIVTIIDEYADLTMSVGSGGDAKAIARSITTSIIRLAQKGRAAGIHVVLATQRPSVDVITGLIKANFPTRIAFRVISRIDSSTILDAPGAEKLIGKGDMLYYAGVETERVQCALIDGDEINRLTEFIGDQQGYQKSYNMPYMLPAVEEQVEEGSGGMVDMKNLDERFEEAAKMVVINQRGSTSDLQRRLGMGYAKAGRVMDQLEAAGVVGPQEGSKPRQVLISSLDELEKVLDAFKNQ